MTTTLFDALQGNRGDYSGEICAAWSELEFVNNARALHQRAEQLGMSIVEFSGLDDPYMLWRVYAEILGIIRYTTEQWRRFDLITLELCSVVGQLRYYDNVGWGDIGELEDSCPAAYYSVAVEYRGTLGDWSVEDCIQIARLCS